MSCRARRGERAGAGRALGQFLPGDRHLPYMAVVEVTSRCDMRCPVCYADAGGGSGEDVPLEEIGRRLERLLDITGSPIPLQISGGEPTLHPQLAEIVSLAGGYGFRNVDLNTNGRRIADGSTSLHALRERGLTGVYLQFDGLRAETHRRIRGRDMTAVRRGAIEAVGAAGLCCTLAVVLTRGVNDGEVGEIVRFAVANLGTVRAVSFQSARRFGARFELGDDGDGYSLPEILRLIETQTGVPADAFGDLEIGHGACNALAPVFVVNGRLKPLFSYLGREEVRAFLAGDGRGKVLDLFRGKDGFFLRHMRSARGIRLLARAAPIFGANPLNVLRSRHILLFAKSFMERDGLDAARIDRCTYAITAGDGVYSFCAFNNVHRFARQPCAGCASGCEGDGRC